MLAIEGQQREYGLNASESKKSKIVEDNLLNDEKGTAQGSNNQSKVSDQNRKLTRMEGKIVIIPIYLWLKMYLKIYRSNKMQHIIRIEKSTDKTTGIYYWDSFAQ